MGLGCIGTNDRLECQPDDLFVELKGIIGGGGREIVIMVVE